MKKALATLILTSAFIFHSSNVHSASVDFGLTLGSLLNNGSVQSGGLIELGTFSGYTDGLGLGFFTGSSYSTLRSSFTSLGSGLTDSVGNVYETVDLGSTASNTRLFAWAFTSGSASSTANWSIISGTIGGGGDYNPMWLAVAPSDITINTIEIGVTSNVLYANSDSSNSLVAVGTPPSANLNLVPEPSTYALMAIGGLVLFFIARRRKAQV